MTLWHTDALGHKEVIATSVASPQEALGHIMQDGKKKFTIPNGKIKIHTNGDSNYSFRVNGDRCLGYTLAP